MADALSASIFIGEAVSSGTAGSILFVDANGKAAQNNPSLFWDNVNFQLKVFGSDNPIHWGPTNSVEGGYLGSTGSSQAWFAGGTHFDAASGMWICDAATGIINVLDLGNGENTFYGTTGLVQGAPYVLGNFIIANFAHNFITLYQGTQVNSFLQIGTTGFPTSGSLRLPNSNAIVCRNNANNNDVVTFYLNTSDQIQLGNPSGANVYIANTIGIGVSPSNATIDAKNIIRTQGNVGPPAAGAGMELSYSASGGQIISFDRTGSAYKVTNIDGSTVVLNGNSAGNVGVKVSPLCALDVSGVIRATGTTVPTGGAGCELSSTGLISFDRTNVLHLNGTWNALSVTFVTGAAVNAWKIDLNQCLIPIGTLATNMTTGFINIPGAAGPPTGVPATTTGFPLYYDSTNDKLYVYRGGWKKGQVSAVDVVYA